MRNSRTFLGVGIGIAISALAFALTLRWAGWRPLGKTLLQLDGRFLGAAVLVFLLSMAARALSWRALLGGRVSFWRVAATLNQGYLLNNLLPWRLGEIGRALLLGRRPGLSIPGVLSSIFLERLYDLFFALLLLITLLPIGLRLPGSLNSAVLAGGLLLVALTFLFLALRLSAWVESLIQALPFTGGVLLDLWSRFREGLTRLRDLRLLVASLTWMAISWATAGIEYWLVLRAVLPEPSLVWAYFMLTITLLGVAVPSSPGYIGVFEAAGVVALSAFGVPADQALAATLVLHAMVYLIASGFGALALIVDGATLGELYRQARDWIVGVATG